MRALSVPLLIFSQGKDFFTQGMTFAAIPPRVLCHGRTASHWVRRLRALWGSHTERERVSKEPIASKWELMETAWDWKTSHWRPVQRHIWMLWRHGGSTFSLMYLQQELTKRNCWSHKAPITVIFFSLASKSAKVSMCRRWFYWHNFSLTLGSHVHVSEEKEQKGEQTSQRVTSRREEKKKKEETQ